MTTFNHLLGSTGLSSVPQPMCVRAAFCGWEDVTAASRLIFGLSVPQLLRRGEDDPHGEQPWLVLPVCIRPTFPAHVRCDIYASTEAPPMVAPFERWQGSFLTLPQEESSGRIAWTHFPGEPRAIRLEAALRVQGESEEIPPDASWKMTLRFPAEAPLLRMDYGIFRAFAMLFPTLVSAEDALMARLYVAALETASRRMPRDPEEAFGHVRDLLAAWGRILSQKPPLRVMEALRGLPRRVQDLVFDTGMPRENVIMAARQLGAAYREPDEPVTCNPLQATHDSLPATRDS